MRATIIADADRLDQLAAADAWLAKWKTHLDYCSPNVGCGCCVEMWEIAGPAEVIETLPAIIRAGGDWADPTGITLKQVRSASSVLSTRQGSESITAYDRLEREEAAG
jgi:hypothetical protein